jgi:hypothetical protein
MSRRTQQVGGWPGRRINHFNHDLICRSIFSATSHLFNWPKLSISRGSNMKNPLTSEKFFLRRRHCKKLPSRCKNALWFGRSLKTCLSSPSPGLSNKGKKGLYLTVHLFALRLCGNGGPACIAGYYIQ